MDYINLPPVSLVVIGKNESRNLDNTFRAIEKIEYPKDKIELIYVDTNSLDNSVEIAKKYTKNVFEEHSIWPTSGLARNRGILEATYNIIHFIDGDIAIHPTYLKRAVLKLINLDIDAVTGYFKEQNMKSFFNRLMNIRRDEINHIENLCESTNGGGTYKINALINVNGYDERILKGQESELGYRFRQAGYKILFIDAIQGFHNFDLNSLFDFIRIKYINGKSLGFVLKLKDDLNAFIIKLKKNANKVLLVNSFTVLIILMSIFIERYWIIIFYFLLRILYLYISNKVFMKRSYRQLYYSLLQYTFSFAVFFGIIAILLSPKYQTVKKRLLKK